MRFHFLFLLEVTVLLWESCRAMDLPGRDSLALGKRQCLVLCRGVCCGNTCCTTAGSTCDGDICVPPAAPPTLTPTTAVPSTTNVASTTNVVPTTTKTSTDGSGQTNTGLTDTNTGSLTLSETETGTITGGNSTTGGATQTVDDPLTTTTGVTGSTNTTGTNTDILTETGTNTSTNGTDNGISDPPPPTATEGDATTTTSEVHYTVSIVLPENTQVPIVYEPAGAWELTGTGSPSQEIITNTAQLPGGKPGDNQFVSFCNNGTKISNKVNSTLSLKFKGVEASLLIAPSSFGGAFSVTLDDEDPADCDSYIPDVNSCFVATPWSRTGLVDGEHNIKVQITGPSVQGSTGGSQLEFSGFVYKGVDAGSSNPDPKPSGPNKWAIIGGCIGGVVVLLAVAVTVGCCVRRKRRAKAEPDMVSVQPADTQSVAYPSSTPGSPQWYPQHQRLRSDQSMSPSMFYQNSPQQHPQMTGSMYGAPESWYGGPSSAISSPPRSPPTNPAVISQDPFSHTQYGSNYTHRRTPSSFSNQNNPFE